MIYGYFVLPILLIVALVIRLAWPRLARTLGQASPGDRTAIELFLANRDETAVTIEKEFWRGGPEGRFAETNIYGVPRGGRFYRVLASDADGQTYRHTLVASDDPTRRDAVLFQQGSKGYWSKVLQ